MLLIRFYHSLDKLMVGSKEYKATCDVRNEINGRRKPDQIVKTYPKDGTDRLPYMPRKFPTGAWNVKQPIWTDDIEFAPVKIPTDATRKVLIWGTSSGKYTIPNGTIQEDAFYHIHFSRDSKTTLGCIRLNSAEDAKELAELVEFHLSRHDKVILEVLIDEE